MDSGLTTLIGRDGDVARAAAVLREPRVRLLTITGPGGVGKSRLAYALALEVGEDFEDGVVFVPLDSIDDPERALPTVARTLGLRETHERPLEAVAAHLRERGLLLVLDTFEHVADASPALPDLLTLCPELKIVVTSRARLRVSGEHEFSLGPLPAEAALALFRERALAVDADLEFSGERLAAAAEICSRLDGLPLAIELAAARVNVLTPEVMRERLENRLEILTSGLRDAPDRQRTLRGTIDWSFELLDAPRQVLFWRLAVFVGGFTLDAAESVGRATVDTLGSLVDSSLIRSQDGRYHMLDTVREYALAQLEVHGAADVQSAHAAYFTELAETAEPMLAGPDQALWRHRLEREQGNFRAAFRSSLEGSDGETALRLGGALWDFWLEHGYLSEGRAWLDEALAVRDRASPQVLARALAGAGILGHYQGDYPRAQELCAESLAVARAHGDRRAIAAALTGTALVARTRGDCEDADRIFQEILGIYEEVGHRVGVARTLDRRGIVAWFLEEYELARSLLVESAEVFREVGDIAGVALARLDLALVTVASGDLESGRGLPEESLLVFRELGDRRNVAKSLYVLGLLACQDGDHEAAAGFLEESLTLFVEFGDRWFACALVLECAADAAIDAGTVERALHLYGAADEQRAQIGVPLPQCFRAKNARHLAEAKALLGADRFEAAWVEGRAIPLRSTVDLVRPPVSAPSPESDLPEGLTAREVEVLALVAEGLTDAEVAERLVVSLRTIHAHLRSIYRKLGLHSRSAATRYALDRQLVGVGAEVTR